jgi:hypothetical protein
LLESGLKVERYVRVTLRERDLEARQAFSQRSRVKLKAVSGWPAVDARNRCVRLEKLHSPFWHAQNVTTGAQEVDFDQMAVSAERFLLFGAV